MSEEKNYNYVSIIGFRYLEPISLLVEELFSLENRSPNEVQASHPENGLSSSIIVLTVFLLESAIARVKFDSKSPTPKSALSFMQRKFPEFKKTDELEELFVIRDSIVHNHIWEASFEWNDEAGMKLLAAELWEGSGDNKLKKVIDESSRRTRLLGLNLFPTRISTTDAAIVLREALSILLFIEENGSPLINPSNQYVKFRGRLVSFEELVEKFVHIENDDRGLGIE